MHAEKKKTAKLKWTNEALQQRSNELPYGRQSARDSSAWKRVASGWRPLKLSRDIARSEMRPQLMTPVVWRIRALAQYRWFVGEIARRDPRNARVHAAVRGANPNQLDILHFAAFLPSQLHRK